MKTKLLVIISLLLSSINFAQNTEFEDLDLKLFRMNQEIIKKIVYPLKKGDIGPEVIYLQEVLLLVVEELQMLPLRQNERLKVIRQLKVEKDKKEYGNITSYVVKLLQKHLGMEATSATGEINKSTADLFNKFLEEINGNDPPPQDKKYNGKAGTVDEAIKDAATKALADHGPDAMINFIIKELKGLHGGIAGFHEVEVSMEVNQVTTTQLCDHVLEYQAYQYKDKVTIIAYGQHNTGGYKVELKLKPIDIFPPEYELIHAEPSEPVAQVITPFTVSVSFHSKELLGTVKVEDGNGGHEVRVKQK